MLARFLCVLATGLCASAQTYTLTTIGNASLLGLGVTVDHDQNVYFVDGYALKKISPSGAVTIVAGSLFNAAFGGDDGPAASATLLNPVRLAVDTQNNIYVYDNPRIRRISPDGVIRTVVGGGNTPPANGVAALAVNLGLPASQNGLTVDSAGSIYIALSQADRVLKVSGGTVNFFAGNGQPYTSQPLGDGGPATSARLLAPTGLAVDASGAVYISEQSDGRVRRVVNGIITTYAGNGTGGNLNEGGQATAASVGPYDVVADRAGNLFIADAVNNRIRKVTAAGIITTIAGGGTASTTGYSGPALNVRLPSPQAIALGDDGALYVTGVGANQVWKLTPDGGASGGNQPAIDSGAIQNGASFEPGIVSGSFFTIKGSNLSAKTNSWDSAIVNGALPTSLEGVSVSVGGKPAYLQYVSPGQINAIAPDIGLGTLSVTVTTPGGTSATVTTTGRGAQPGFFVWPGGYAVATRTDYTWAVKNGTFAGVNTTAAKSGEVLVLWGTGFGQTTPAAPFGVQVPMQTYATAPVMVTVGGRSATVYGGALAPGFAGLYQIAIQVPAGMASGDYPVVATVNGASSPATVLLTVQP